MSACYNRATMVVSSARSVPELDRLRPDRGRLLVVSGPSGVGKDAVLAALFASPCCPDRLVRCVTATTRLPREGEVPGRDYLFLDHDDFVRRIGEGFFLEHAEYAGDLYGTPRGAVVEQRMAGSDVLLKIEVQGAAQVRQAMPDAVLIFIAPPSWSELERRLRRRATDGPEQVARRLDIARQETRTAAAYDYIVVNDSLSRAADVLRAIVLSERARVRASGEGACQ